VNEKQHEEGQHVKKSQHDLESLIKMAEEEEK
jgi:hypothetical protein